MVKQGIVWMGFCEDGMVLRITCDDHDEKRGYLLLCTSFRYLSTVVTAIWTSEVGFLPGLISRCLAPCDCRGVISLKQCYRSTVAVVVTHDLAAFVLPKSERLDDEGTSRLRQNILAKQDWQKFETGR